MFNVISYKEIKKNKTLGIYLDEEFEEEDNDKEE